MDMEGPTYDSCTLNGMNDQRNPTIVNIIIQVVVCFMFRFTFQSIVL